MVQPCHSAMPLFSRANIQPFHGSAVPWFSRAKFSHAMVRPLLWFSHAMPWFSHSMVQPFPEPYHGVHSAMPDPHSPTLTWRRPVVPPPAVGAAIFHRVGRSHDGPRCRSTGWPRCTGWMKCASGAAIARGQPRAVAPTHPPTHPPAGDARSRRWSGQVWSEAARRLPARRLPAHRGCDACGHGVVCPWCGLVVARFGRRMDWQLYALATARFDWDMGRQLCGLGMARLDHGMVRAYAVVWFVGHGMAWQS